MDQCLEEMRKLPTETLLNIINKERFEHKPEEVRAALYVLNERNVQYEYLSDNEIRYMNRDSVWKWLKQLFAKNGYLAQNRDRLFYVVALLVIFGPSCWNWIESNVNGSQSDADRMTKIFQKSPSERDFSIWMVPNESANRPIGISVPSSSSSPKSLFDTYGKKFQLAPSTNSLSTSSQEGSWLQNQPSLELHNPSLPSYKKTRDYSKPLDLSIQKPSAPDISKRK
jgi:hypothetical protein